MKSGTTVLYTFKMIFDLRMLLFRLQSQNDNFCMFVVFVFYCDWPSL